MPIASFDNVVIFTGNAGNANQEYHASDDPNNPERHDIDASFTGLRGPYVATWYTPIDNIGDLSAFSTIEIHPDVGDFIQLNVSGYGPSNKRVRLRIFVMTP